MAAIDLLSPKAVAIATANAEAGLTPSAIAAVAGLVVAGGTGAAAGGWDTAPNRDTSITTIGEIKTKLNSVITVLKANGLAT